MRGSWNNAKKILELHRVGEFPGNDSKRAVISLTSGICHTVSCSGHSKKPLSCDDQCPKFKSQGICAHTIAVACSYTPCLSTLVGSSIPNHTGRKENEKKQRKRSNNDLRDVSGVSFPADEDSGSEQNTDKLEVVFIRDTAACKCYGCNGSVRRKPSEDPPPAPYDIFLRRREYRVYRKKGSTKMCIAKTKEFVYYHPLKACLPKESSHDDLLMSENTTSRLQASHREVFWREFGFTL